MRAMSASSGTARPAGEESLHRLAAVDHALTQHLEEALRACGAGIDQWRILGLLAERGGCPMSTVAEHAMLLAPKASKLVDRMVAANLVQRRADPGDRRRVLVVVSVRGRAALAEWDAATDAVRRRYRAALGPDADLFDELLTRLQHELGAGRPAAGLAGLRTGGG